MREDGHSISLFPNLSKLSVSFFKLSLGYNNDERLASHKLNKDFRGPTKEHKGDYIGVWKKSMSVEAIRPKGVGTSSQEKYIPVSFFLLLLLLFLFFIRHQGVGASQIYIYIYI